MVNRPRAKGTMAEAAVVEYLRENGWPHCERRALNGSVDRGDIAGCPGLAWEVKYAGHGLRIGPWLAEAGIERLNANADHGILVIKPLGVGVTKVDGWYAAMVQADFDKLKQVAENEVNATFHKEGTLGLFVVDVPVVTYTAATLRWSLQSLTKSPALAPNEVAALTLRPPGTKDKPDAWYRVMTLAHMVRLLRAAGYGDRENEQQQQS